MQPVVPGVPVYRANLGDVVRRQREERADAASPVEEVPGEETSGCGACGTDRYGEIAGVVDEPDGPPSNLATTGSSTIDAIRVDGWRVDVGSPEDRERTDRLLRGGAEAPPPATAA